MSAAGVFLLLLFPFIKVVTFIFVVYVFTQDEAHRTETKTFLRKCNESTYSGKF